MLDFCDDYKYHSILGGKAMKTKYDWRYGHFVAGMVLGLVGLIICVIVVVVKEWSGHPTF